MTASLLYADPATLWARALRRVVRLDSGCWEFTGAVNSRGYGMVGAGLKGRTVLVHRLAVIASGRTIPEGMTVDHTCHETRDCPEPKACPHRRCCNPAHLAVVTSAANSARKFDGVTTCQRGHEFSPENTNVRANGRRACIACRRAAQRAAYDRNHPRPTRRPNRRRTGDPVVILLAPIVERKESA